MPKPDDTRPNDKGKSALNRFDEDLRAFDAKRAKPAVRMAEAGAASDGYRLAAGLIGGVFGGLGLGWSLDHFAHTSPFGLIGGLLIGVMGSIYAAIRGATRMNAQAAAKQGSTASVSDDDE